MRKTPAPALTPLGEGERFFHINVSMYQRNSMSAVICGSIAFDSIMTFNGRFAEQILPDQLHILNVSFLVPTLRREFGGCAGNVAYGLKQLGGVPLPMGTVGRDGAEYMERFKNLGISTEFVRQIDDAFTAQAMIMADHDNNQISAFHPGAMDQAHLINIEARQDIKLGIISPDAPQAMRVHAEQFKAADVPFIFDPGQNLPAFDGKELAHFVDLASWVAVNDYEEKLLCDRMGLSTAEISKRVKGLVVTLGEHGCQVWVDGEKTAVPGVKAKEVLDPTGCGDAFRAALLYGLELGWPLERCAQLGNRMGAQKIAHRGGQNYTITS